MKYGELYHLNDKDGYVIFSYWLCCAEQKNPAGSLSQRCVCCVCCKGIIPTESPQYWGQTGTVGQSLGDLFCFSTQSSFFSTGAIFIISVSFQICRDKLGYFMCNSKDIQIVKVLSRAAVVGEMLNHLYNNVKVFYHKSKSFSSRGTGSR